MNHDGPFRTVRSGTSYEKCSMFVQGEHHHLVTCSQYCHLNTKYMLNVHLMHEHRRDLALLMLSFKFNDNTDVNLSNFFFNCSPKCSESQKTTFQMAN